MDKDAKEQYFKERYDIECPECGHLMQCAPSIGHRLGLFEFSGGNCTKWNQQFDIKFMPETNSMSISLSIFKEQ